MNETSVVRIAASEVNDGWPVRVYRKTEQYGWQRMRPKNAQGRTVILRASPRSGCIVLPRIQVRIRLSSSTDETKDNDVLVVRRRNTMLVSSRSRVRSLVFKFADLRSCLGFSDRLIELNPNHQNVWSIPRTTSQMNGMFSSTSHDRSKNIADGTDLSSEENQQVLSLVGRLLCDEDFAKLCNNLESSIRASEDGLQLLSALISDSKALPFHNSTNS